jgi:hypothetical protein
MTPTFVSSLMISAPFMTSGSRLAVQKMGAWRSRPPKLEVPGGGHGVLSTIRLTDLLGESPHNVVRLSHQQTIADALKLLSQYNILSAPGARTRGRTAHVARAAREASQGASAAWRLRWPCDSAPARARRAPPREER